MQMNSYIGNYSAKHEYTVQLSKTFLFQVIQVIQFSQTVHIQTIQFRISIVFSLLTVKCQNSSILSNSV